MKQNVCENVLSDSSITMIISIVYLRWIIVIKMLSTVVPVTYCCSSRIFRPHERAAVPLSAYTSSSRVPTRKNSSLKHRVMSEKDSKFISSIIYSKCSKEFDDMYCQHGGRCFNYTVANYSHPSCECTEGYMGERCEVKYYSVYYPLRRVKIRVASVCLSAAAASLLSTLILYYCQNRCFNYFTKQSHAEG